MTNQELKDFLACFEGSSLTKLKLSTQEFTIELERSLTAAPAVPASAPAPAVPAPKAPEGDLPPVGDQNPFQHGL